jgi:hypothetical protein
MFPIPAAALKGVLFPSKPPYLPLCPFGNAFAVDNLEPEKLWHGPA